MGTYTITTTPKQDLAIEAESRRSGTKDVETYVQTIANARLTDLAEQVVKERKATGKELLEKTDDATLAKVMALLEKVPGDPTSPKDRP